MPLPTSIKNSSTVLAVLLLQACAAPRGLELPALDDWETRSTVLQAQDRWEFRGRIGVSAGDEGFNGKLHWRQNGETFDTTVSGPLGVGTVRIEGERGQILLTDKQGQVTALQDAEADLRTRYGWTIPVDSLRYWALGIPDPSSPASTEFDETGLLASIQQRGWTVTIGQYREGGGQQMPRRISALGGDAKVRLVIDHWAFY